MKCREDETSLDETRMANEAKGAVVAQGTYDMKLKVVSH